MLNLVFHVSVLQSSPTVHTYYINPCLLDTDLNLHAGFCEGPCNHFTGTVLQSYKYKNKHIGNLGKYSYINIIKTQNRTSMCRFIKVLNFRVQTAVYSARERGKKRSPPKIKQIFNLAHGKFQRLMVMIL